MKTRTLLAASLLANALLLGTAVYLSNQDPGEFAAPPLVVCVPHPSPDALDKPASGTAAVADPVLAINWGRIESKYYSQYVDHLRSLGCPDQTIRGIIMADVTDLFRSRVMGQVYSANRFGR